MTGTRSASEVVNVLLGVSSIILMTLRDTSKISPVPYLSNAAGIALDIIMVVQNARQNRDGFKRLASDSCELVYVIVRGHKDISRVENVPGDLVENLRQLVITLASIQRFAQRSASRNFVKSVLCSAVDSAKIQDYREMLQQSMRIFSLQSDISLRYTVAELAFHQVKIMNELRYRSTDYGTQSGDGEGHVPP